MNLNSGKRYRLYIDESGDHTYSLDEKDIAKRYLGITGVIFEQNYYKKKFHSDFEQFKQRHFPYNPDEPVIFHRKELIGKRGPFRFLLNPENENIFNKELLQLFKVSDYQLITVVIDKTAQFIRYGEYAMHPYHYCLVAMLERYCGLLNFLNTEGDVMAESRGGREDMQLKEAYKNVYESGTSFRDPSFFQRALTSNEIKVKDKKMNITGLQLADLLAHPCKTEILWEKGRIDFRQDGFGQKISECTSDKHNRHVFNGQISGYGKVFLA
jgi:hypothetical protein